MSKKNYLKVGDIIELKPGYEVYAWIEERLVYANRKFSSKLTEHAVTIDEENFSHLLGEFVVYKANLEGGGTGHGPNDVYPDGWKVTCRSLADPMIDVSFYQSGCFTAMITDIKPVRTLTQKKLAEVLYFEVDSEDFLKLRHKLAAKEAEVKELKRKLHKIEKIIQGY
jgi:hypothetical protein